MVERLHPELNWARAPRISHFTFGYSKSIYEHMGYVVSEIILGRMDHTDDVCSTDISVLRERSHSALGWTDGRVGFLFFSRFTLLSTSILL